MIKMDKTFKPPVRPSIEPKLTESAKLAADMAAFLAAGGQVRQVQTEFDFYDPQGRVPLVGTTAYSLLCTAMLWQAHRQSLKRAMLLRVWAGALARLENRRNSV
jgi:hypothetical protein